jgi:sensor histidine kinase regulating citrate/malate metabolism
MVVIAAEHLNDAVRVKVSNQNFGLQQSDAAKFFTDGYSTKTNGNGFGLTVVQDLANKLGGSVDCEISEREVHFALHLQTNIVAI